MALGRLASRLCRPGEAVGLLWHTVHGLLAGPSASAEPVEEDQSEQSAAITLAKVLLEDVGFTQVLGQQLSEACLSVAAAHGLDWSPTPPSDEACTALGVSVADLDLQALATSCRASVDNEVLAEPQTDDVASAAQGDDKPDPVWAGGGDGPYRELFLAALEVTARHRSAGVVLSPQLIGTVLVGSTEMLEVLHRRRFGDLSAGGAPKREAAPEAVEAARACLIVDHVRLCGNVLYEQPSAQNFIRLTSGLKALLSHCYADPELPMLREVSVFAVRNATHGCVENQAAARGLLAVQRKAAAEQGGSGPLPPGAAEFDFGG